MEYSLYFALMVATFAVPLIGGRLAFRAVGRRFRRGRDLRLAGHCRCGYPLGHLAVPRCPECGRVVGFEATAEELGLNDEQLCRVQLVRDNRRDGGGA